MRPILAVIVAAAILGSVHLFLQSARNDRLAPVDFTPELATGKYRVDILTTFAAGPDPFESVEKAAALTVWLRGQAVFTERERLPQGKLIVIDDISGVTAGVNEFYVTAVPEDPDPDMLHAVRIRVLRDDLPLAEDWLVSLPGRPVDAAVTIDVPAAEEDEEHVH